MFIYTYVISASREAFLILVLAIYPPIVQLSNPFGKVKRRQFVFGILGTTAVGMCGIRSLSNPLISRALNDLKKYTQTGSALGTKVALTVYHPNSHVAYTAMEEALAAIDRVESIMSLYRPDSQLCQLNRDGKLLEPHPHLTAILDAANNLSKISLGAFDISVQPLWQSYESASKRGRLPTSSEISVAQQKVNWRDIEISNDRISFQKSGMAITLNGIAQGFAADEAAKALSKYGINHALIDSGEISTVGQPASKDSWNIAIKHPRKTDSFHALTALRNRCLATSGDYETTFSSNYEQHHLLDPRTGKSPRELSSVTIAAPTATEADALSTAVFLMGQDKGKELIESLPNVDALFVDKANQTSHTGNFPLMS